MGCTVSQASGMIAVTKDVEGASRGVGKGFYNERI